MRSRFLSAAAAVFLVLVAAVPAYAQFGGGPPAVGTVLAEKHAITETSEYVGRVQAIDRVDLVARVTAFIQERAFTEGAEVQQGQLLYRLERGPFEADLAAKQASVAQIQALLHNASIVLGRAQSLLGTPAGQRSAVDDAQAQAASLAAQLLSAQAQVRASQINLDYTEIRAPISGKIGRSALSVGNVVTPASGPLATIFSQDPMYVVFPVSVRAVLDLRKRYGDKGGYDAVAIKLRLSDGLMYRQTGKLEFLDPSVSSSTDTLTLRATIPNPLVPGAKLGELGNRELVDGEFVTVTLEGVEPVQLLGIPRTAVLSDQQGSYVYVVGADSKAEQRRVVLGQSTPDTAVILSGLQEGETVIAEGLQKVRPGAPVNAAPVGQKPAGAAGPAAGAAPAKG